MKFQKHSSPTHWSPNWIHRRVSVFSLPVYVKELMLALLVCRSASVMSVTRVERNFYLELILVKIADV